MKLTSFSTAFGGFGTEGDVFVPVALNSEVALECDVLPSRPPPQITWRIYVDGNEVETPMTGVRFLNDSRYLYISSVQETDLMSTYRCEVTNAFIDRTIPAPTTYRLLDNLTRGELVDYKQIGEVMAFVGSDSIEFAYVGGVYGNGAVNGTSNRLFRDGGLVTTLGNIGMISDLSTPGDSTLSATVTFDGNSEMRSGTLTVNRKYLNVRIFTEEISDQ